MSETMIMSVLTVVISAVTSMSLVNWRLAQIEKRLDAHNNYAQKFADATTDMALIKQDIKYIKSAIEEVKGK